MTMCCAYRGPIATVMFVGSAKISICRPKAALMEVIVRSSWSDATPAR